MPRIKTGRSFKVETLCDFSQADQSFKVINDFIFFLYIISIYYIDLFDIVNLAHWNWIAGRRIIWFKSNRLFIRQQLSIRGHATAGTSGILWNEEGRN